MSEVSTNKSKAKEDNGGHAFAKDGFTYIKAYFRDFDGKYYLIMLSIGNKNDIGAVYNVGKIKEAPFPLVAQRPGTESTGGRKASTDSITNKQQNVNSNVRNNTENPFANKTKVRTKSNRCWSIFLGRFPTTF